MITLDQFRFGSLAFSSDDIYVELYASYSGWLLEIVDCSTYKHSRHNFLLPKMYGTLYTNKLKLLEVMTI